MYVPAKNYHPLMFWLSGYRLSEAISGSAF
jgi:hypothetical protein